jgi:hypothetical protein
MFDMCNEDSSVVIDLLDASVIYTATFSPFRHAGPTAHQPLAAARLSPFPSFHLLGTSPLSSMSASRGTEPGRACLGTTGDVPALRHVILAPLPDLPRTCPRNFAMPKALPSAARRPSARTGDRVSCVQGDASTAPAKWREVSRVRVRDEPCFSEWT